jgi:DNA-binding MarR family transcriptional regulator
MKKNLFAPNYYVTIYDEAMQTWDVSVQEAWLLIKIYNLSQAGIGHTTVYTRTLAEIANCSTRKMNYMIKKLVEKNLIIHMVVNNNRARMRPSPEVKNKICAWNIENETVKGLNSSASGY